MHNRHVFIVNPAAGKGIALDTEKRIRDLFQIIRQHYPDTEVQILRTEYAGHATDLARFVTQEGTGCLYAVGGDGTVNEVLNGMVHSDWSLAIIPGGTGNDFIHRLVDKHLLGDILKETILGEEVAIDVGQVNDQYFLNIVSVGFDARVNQRAGKFRRHRLIGNKLAYVAGIITSLRDRGEVAFDITDHEGSRREAFFMAAFCNGQTYGGGFPIAPRASLLDGLLDFVFVRNITPSRLARYIPKLIKGDHLHLEGISWKQQEKIHLAGREPFLINIDGESERVEAATIKLAPMKLKLILPKEAALALVKDQPSKN